MTSPPLSAIGACANDIEEYLQPRTRKTPKSNLLVRKYTFGTTNGGHTQVSLNLDHTSATVSSDDNYQIDGNVDDSLKYKNKLTIFGLQQLFLRRNFEMGMVLPHLNVIEVFTLRHIMLSPSKHSMRTPIFELFLP
ncbi:MAG: hypothetical protein MUO31_07585, partial [Thermodesulfovibrionales bacterium]|nr:hypothetical protein [Thermodesulfovibrionales bacterium]